MRREKMNNKGFSLVELIIVIAIMAILSAALAPQLMKYVEKSRVSTDQSSCSSIESCVNAALADEDIYKQVATAGKAGGVMINIAFTAGDDTKFTATTNPSCKVKVGNADGTKDLIIEELNGTLSALKAPKQTGKQFYCVKIETTEDTATGTMTVGKIACKTSSKELKTKAEFDAAK